MMRTTTAAATLALVCALVGPVRAANNTPTFNKDVAPIVFGKCASCHRPNQPTPMSLLSYEDVRPWARAIKQKVVAREMPPWFADHRFGTFHNNPSLSVKEIATITRWVDAGAPRGSAPLGAVPHFSDGWNHPSGRLPDVVLQFPYDFDVPADGQLPIFSIYSTLPPSLAKQDNFIESVQLMPGNIPIVHHASLSARTLPRGVRLGTVTAWPGGPVLRNVPVADNASEVRPDPGRELSAAEAFSSAGTSHLVYYFPGNNGFAQFPVGVGKRLRARDYIEWGLHYTPTGRAEKDRPRAALWLHKNAPTHEVITFRIGDFHIVNGHETIVPAGVKTAPGHAAMVNIPGKCGGTPCLIPTSLIPVIPPHADNWKITAITPFQDDVTLYDAYPHGHLRLKHMTYVLTYPDGREETILSVPKFEFAWQLVYRWIRPLQVPAGATVKVIGHYDNSARNAANPGADKPVNWGEQSTEEMFNGFLNLSIDKFALGSPRAQEKSTPKIPLVLVAGCASRDAAGAWKLTRGSEPRLSDIVHADAAEIEDASKIPLGSLMYRLIGTAEFGSVSQLLAQGQRSQFTGEKAANSTRRLQHGHKIAVKALLVERDSERRLNLLSVQSLSSACQ